MSVARNPYGDGQACERIATFLKKEGSHDGRNKEILCWLGCIGLPTAAIIASRGIPVVGVDVSEKTVATINEGKIHIVEPDLDMVVQAAVTTGKFRATLTAEVTDVFMIGSTPFTKQAT